MHMTTSTRQVGGVTIVDIGGRIVLGEEGGCTARAGLRPAKQVDTTTFCSILAMSITSTALAWAIWSVPSRGCGSKREN